MEFPGAGLCQQETIDRELHVPSQFWKPVRGAGRAKLQVWSKEGLGNAGAAIIQEARARPQQPPLNGRGAD